MLALFVPTAVADHDSATADLQRAAPDETKVTICHRTDSRTNPYNQIVVTESAAISGHAAEHRGPIFAPEVDYWGDIIAPIRPGLPRGRNWPEGRPILSNGCEMEPDVGPIPETTIADVDCAGTTPSVAVTVTNRTGATRPAFFRIFVDGTVVETVGPLAPGESETVILSGDLAALEDQTFTIEVRSGGKVIGSRVVTVDCAAAAPPIEIDADLVCAGQIAQANVTVTNNGADPVEMTAAVDGTAVGTPMQVAPGASETGTIDLSPYEDQTITVDVLVDGVVVGTYTVTPDCVAPQPIPRVSVAGQECPPPTSTVTLANEGDPASQVVFVIRVNLRVVQRSAPLYGGDTTTIVADLSLFEDQTVIVTLRSNGELLARRKISVNCERSSPGPGPGPGAGPGAGPSTGPGTGPGVLPPVGAEIDPVLIALALGMLGGGSLLILASGPRSRKRSEHALPSD